MMGPVYSVLLTAALLATKGAVLIAVAWMAATIFKRSGPSIRQWIWFSALAGLLILPVAMTFVPKLTLPILDLKPDTASRSMEGSAAIIPASTPTAVNETPSDRGRWIAPVYFLGMAFSLALILLGRQRSVGIRRRARQLPLEENLNLLERLQIRRDTGQIRIYVSGDAAIPFIHGIFRPVVVLPAEFREWPAERLKSALLHEAAHIQRRDLPARFMGAAACIVHWFNPLAWSALRRMIREQESSCDLFVIGHGVKVSRYAVDLLSFSHSAARIPEFGPAGMSDAANLLFRLENLLNPKSLDFRSKPVSLWAGAAAVVIILLTAALTPWNEADPYAALRTEAAIFLYKDVAPVHRNILSESDDAFYIERLSTELRKGQFNKYDFEAHLARLRAIESQAGAGQSSLRETARNGRAALLNQYMPSMEKYSPVLDDFRKARRSTPNK